LANACCHASACLKSATGRGCTRRAKLGPEGLPRLTKSFIWTCPDSQGVVSCTLLNKSILPPYNVFIEVCRPYAFKAPAESSEMLSAESLARLLPELCTPDLLPAEVADGALDDALGKRPRRHGPRTCGDGGKDGGDEGGGEERPFCKCSARCGGH